MKIDISISYTAGEHWFKVDNHEKYGFRLDEDDGVFVAKNTFFGDNLMYDAEMWLKSMLCDVRVNDPERCFEISAFENLFRKVIVSLDYASRRGNYIDIQSLRTFVFNTDGCDMWIIASVLGGE